MTDSTFSGSCEKDLVPVDPKTTCHHLMFFQLSCWLLRSQSHVRLKCPVAFAPQASSIKAPTKPNSHLSQWENKIVFNEIEIKTDLFFSVD